MAFKWSKIGSMIELGRLNHGMTLTEEQLINEVETQLALAAIGNKIGNKKVNETRRAHLTLMIHPRIALVFPNLLAEAKRQVAESDPEKGRPKLEHVLWKLCNRQAKSSGPPLVAFKNLIKRRG